MTREFAGLSRGALALLMAACVLYSCGQTRQQRWDSQTPEQRLNDAIKSPSNNPPGYGGNTYD